MATFQTFIDSIYRDGNDGKQFERFVKWFLKNDPEWSTQVDEVWSWDEWPERWGADKGIDLIFRHRNGEMWAVQAKCYDPDYYVTKADMDSFLSESNRESISRRLLMASTDRIGENARETCAGQEKPVTRFMLSDFEKAEIDYPDDYKDLRSAKRKQRPAPHDYQEDAIGAVAQSFETADRGQLIMACGTGKTFTTLWIKERTESQSTLVLVPSLNLLAQTAREWTFASKNNLDVCCVCSDQSVGRRRDEDEVIQSISDAPFPVLNQPSEIARFLEGEGDKVVFSTYQSSPLIEEVYKNQSIPSFDLVIADEAHRCASAGKTDSAFTTVLDGEKIRAKKRLFTTATPRVYSSQVTKAAEDKGVEIFGMDDTSVFGEVFHTLSFGEAINRDPPLLTDYQVIIVGVDDAMIADWIENRELVTTESGETVTDAETLAAQIGLLKATRDYDLKRLISFHGRVKSAEYFAADLEQARTIVDERHLPRGTINADYVSGAMPTHDRQAKLRALRDSTEDQISILSNARCLSEGVDVPSLDGVAFIDPRSSDVDIIQAVGRAIRLSKDKSIGSIVIPVFIQSGDDVEEALEQSSFKKIWWVINALKAHDGALANELDEVRVEMGRHSQRSVDRSGLTKVILDLPTTVDVGFADALRTQLVEQTTASWNFWFGLLETYVETNGHCRVPQRHKEGKFALGSWVGTQRKTRDILSPERNRRLESIGFIWDPFAAAWEEGFAALMQFQKREGHCLVPRKHKEGEFQLGIWVHTQRKAKDTISPERRQKLESIGFIWDLLAAAWEEGFAALMQFQKREGHCRVTRKHKKEGKFNLGRWVRQQRETKDTITPERRQRLESIGFVWDPFAADWEEGFAALIEFQKREGHCRVHGKLKEGKFNLGRWVSRQREVKDTISPERKQRLEALDGWIWVTKK